jgi:hypothetical protein
MTGRIGKLAPVIALLVVLVISALAGYLWAISTVSIVNVGPWQLEPSYQGIYVQSVADSFALDRDNGLAAERLSFLCQTDGGLDAAFASAQQRYGGDVVKQDNLSQLRSLVDNGQVMQNEDLRVCSTRPNNAPSAIMGILAPLVLVLMALGIVGYGVLTIIQSGEEEAAPTTVAATGAAAPAAPAAAPATGAAAAPAAPAAAPAADAERKKSTAPSGFSIPGLGRKKTPAAAETARSAAARGAQLSATVEKTDFSVEGMEEPLVQFMTTYLKGDDLYDDSFSIDSPSGEFLGECGVGISETIGSAEGGKNITAFEVWLFDKNDIRTITKVLMSDHAYNDDAIRAKLAPKGEAVLVKAGDRISLDTASLRVQARVVDLSYNPEATPPNSVFDRITLELAAWKSKEKSAAPGE